MGISDRAIISLAENCVNLKRVGMGCCDDVGDRAVYALARRPSLTDIDISHNRNITDGSVLMLVRNCALSTITMPGCTAVTDAAVSGAAQCRSLTSVDM